MFPPLRTTPSPGPQNEKGLTWEETQECVSNTSSKNWLVRRLLTWGVEERGEYLLHRAIGRLSKLTLCRDRARSCG